MDRYGEKPLLRLLECYVLSAIGLLDVKQQAVLQRMEPKLRETFKSDGSWTEILEAQMAFPDTMPQQIQELWKGYVDEVRRSGNEPDPNQFALNVVDRSLRPPA